MTFLDLKQEESCIKKIEQPKKQNNHPLGTQQKLLVMIILLCASPALFLHDRVLLRSSQLRSYNLGRCAESVWSDIPGQEAVGGLQDEDGRGQKAGSPPPGHPAEAVFL